MPLNVILFFFIEKNFVLVFTNGIKRLIEKKKTVF